MDRDTERLIVGCHMLRVWAEANGGREPRTIWQYRRVARRFGVRIHWLPRDADVQACRRDGQRAGMQGVIFVRRTHNLARLRLELLHELGEAATRWEGVPPFVCQLSRHEVACAAVALTC